MFLLDPSTTGAAIVSKLENQHQNRPEPEPERYISGPLAKFRRYIRNLHHRLPLCTILWGSLFHYGPKRKTQSMPCCFLKNIRAVHYR